MNAAGPITPLGAGQVGDDVLAEVEDILKRAVDMVELQALASDAVREAFAAEAGCVTGCTAAGIAVASAAAMAGTDLARIEQLPDTRGMKDEVVLPRAHDCWFGARVGQMIRVSGAKIAYAGSESGCSADDVRAALSDRTAAAVFVASHHVPQAGILGLEDLVAACGDVPVIVDAAGSVDIAPYLRAGAALVLASAQKNFGGLTAGIVAGRADLVAACLAQERGIGRAMKAGKEAVAGVIAGLRRHRESQPAREAAWLAAAQHICALLQGTAGIVAEVERDAPEERIPRARVALKADACRITAAELAARLRADDPPIRVWEAGLAAGHFAIDPRCLEEGEAELVCRRIRAVLAASA